MKKTLFMILILSVLAVGCTTSGDTGTSLSDPWIGGTDGIIISFEEDAPQAEVFDGGDFPFGVVVKLKNEGEYTVPKEDVKVTISGILASEFGKQESDLELVPEDSIEGKLKDTDGKIRDSDPVFIDFGDFTYLSELVAQQSYTLRAEACYKYQTTANSQICVLKDNLDTEDSVCKVNENKQVFSSGAPVQVTEFKESSRGKDKIAFSFTVSHKGNGRIFEQSSGCDTSSRAFEDRVSIEIDTGLEGALECSGLRDETSGAGATTGQITLFSNEKPITCTQTITTNSDYQQPVVIKLTYDYKDSKETSVLVKHQLN